MFLRIVAHCYEENANQEKGSTLFEQRSVGAGDFSVQSCRFRYLNSVNVSEGSNADFKAFYAQKR